MTLLITARYTIFSEKAMAPFTCPFHFYALEKEMATHSSVLAWRIPGMGPHRVGHDWSDLAVAAAAYYFLCHLFQKIVSYVPICVTEPVIKGWCAVPYEINDCDNITLWIWEEATRGNIFLDQEASNTAMVQRLLLLTRPGPITAQQVARQWNLR